MRRVEEKQKQPAAQSPPIGQTSPPIPSTQTPLDSLSLSDVSSSSAASLDVLLKNVRETSAKEAERILDERKRDLESLIQEKQIKHTEILGVFVALFTFVSIEIQIFSRVTSLSNAVIFTYLIFLCMVGFLFMLHLILSLKNGTLWQSLASAIFPFLGLLFIIFSGYFFISRLIKDDIPLSKQENYELQEINRKIIKLDSEVKNLKEALQYLRK